MNEKEFNMKIDPLLSGEILVRYLTLLECGEKKKAANLLSLLKMMRDEADKK